MKEIGEESQNTKLKPLQLLLQIDHKDLLFADFIVADITSGLKNWIFTEFVPCTIYPFYGI